MDAHPPRIFDRGLVRRHRERAARKGLDHILGKIVAEEVLDRLSTVQRQFRRALVLGPSPLVVDCIRRRVPESLWADLGAHETSLAGPQSSNASVATTEPRVIADDEALPFAEGAFDLAVSALSLHWLNDLPGALIQIRRCLEPDGLFLGALLGGNTLHELRQALSQAEIEIRSGLAARFSPSIDIGDAGALLQRAGFALPVTDVDKLSLRFETPLDLIHALRDSAETNALAEQARPSLHRKMLARMLEIYAERFPHADGGVRAEFDVIYLTGWSPHEGQQQPLAPGSARMRLSEALRTREQAAGEKAGPRKP